MGIRLQYFYFLYFLINNIQCFKLNVNLIKESNIYEIKTTFYQNIGPIGDKGHDYYVFENGDYYDGKFVNGLANDKHGKYYFKDKNTVYFGEFKNGKIEDKGYYRTSRYTIPYRIIYEGEFYDGMADGKGIYTYKNGDKYEGEFRNGKREGKGEYKWNINDKKELLVPYLFKMIILVM